MHFVYILYSDIANRFYVGETEDLERRIDEHKKGHFQNSFTKRATDWKLYFTIKCENRVQARRIERHIKQMKSRKYIQNLSIYPEIVSKLLETNK